MTNQEKLEMEQLIHRAVADLLAEQLSARCTLRTPNQTKAVLHHEAAKEGLGARFGHLRVSEDGGKEEAARQDK